MNRFFVAIVMVGLAGISANGQTGASALQTSAGVSASTSEFPDKAELLRRVALYEAALKNSHADNQALAKIYMELGGLYGDSGMYLKAEDAMRHGTALLRNGPQDELAGAIGHLVTLHLAMGELRDAEREQLDALRIREGLGEAVGTAHAWSDLASVYVKQEHYKKAVEDAQKAMDVLGDDPKVDVEDRITVQATLGYVLCRDKEFARGLPLLKDSLEMSKSHYGADSLEVGVAYYLLGFAEWEAGDMEDAAEWMGRGINRMKVDMGWGHPIYLNAVSQYAQFLRKHGQMEAAADAQREVRQAQSVVDARSFTGR